MQEFKGARMQRCKETNARMQRCWNADANPEATDAQSNATDAGVPEHRATRSNARIQGCILECICNPRMKRWENRDASSKARPQGWNHAEMQNPTQGCSKQRQDAAPQTHCRKDAGGAADVQGHNLPIITHRGSKSASALRDSGARMSLSRMLTTSANLGRRERSCCQHCIISW